MAKSFRSQSTPIRQLLGAQATKRQLRTAITECCPSCLHVATHAVDPSAAGTTALVLCPEPHSGDVSDNGLLEINQDLRVATARMRTGGPERLQDGRRPTDASQMAASVGRAFLCGRSAPCRSKPMGGRR